MDDQQVPPPAEPEPPASGEVGPEIAPEAVDEVPTEGPTSQWVQPAPSSGPSRALPLILAVVVIGVIGIVAALIFIGANADPRDSAAREFGQRLIDMPEFKARYGDVDTPEEAYELGQTIGARAFARLDDASLLRYWQLTEILIGNADDKTCTRIMRQTIEPGDAEALGKTLAEDQYRELLDISFRAFEAELKGTPGPPAPTDADVQAASLALANAVGMDQVTQAATALQDPAAADADVCDAAKLFLNGVLQLEEPHRATFLRYMASP
jgi:hypothetical protein